MYKYHEYGFVCFIERPRVRSSVEVQALVWQVCWSGAAMAQVGANMEYQEYKWAYSIMDSSK